MMKSALLLSMLALLTSGCSTANSKLEKQIKQDITWVESGDTKVCPSIVRYSKDQQMAVALEIKDCSKNPATCAFLNDYSKMRCQALVCKTGKVTTYESCNPNG